MEYNEIEIEFEIGDRVRFTVDARKIYKSAPNINHLFEVVETYHGHVTIKSLKDGSRHTGIHVDKENCILEHYPEKKSKIFIPD